MLVIVEKVVRLTGYPCWVPLGVFVYSTINYIVPREGVMLIGSLCVCSLITFFKHVEDVFAFLKEMNTFYWL